MSLLIGLTGGIGSGKSTVARLFAELGAGIIDTDEIARQLTAAGGEAMPAIKTQFGPEYVEPSGAMNRPAMRRKVFTDAAAKLRLETILHPMIRGKVRDLLVSANQPYLLLVVPLLVETGGYRDIVRRVLVVDCPEVAQIARTMARSGLSRVEVEAILASQSSRAQRLARADDVITNDADIDSLRAQVESLHQCYLRLAEESTKR